MKITVKNLKQVQYPISISSDSITIKELKERFSEVHSEFPSSSLKFLYNGIVLNDEKRVLDYKIKEGDTIIMMVTKSHIIHKENKINSPKKEKEEEEEKEKKKEKPKEKKKEYLSELSKLLEMGFDKEMSEKVLKMTKGNLQSAIELAMKGITEDENNEEEEEEEENHNQSSIPTLKTISSVIKVLCQQDPSSLEDILQTLHHNAPELMNMITNNQEEFENLLKEPMNEEDLRNFHQFQIENGELFGDDEEDDEQINLSKEEMDAVKRIQEFAGVTEADATQAFIACEKNEELACNFVLENKFGNDSMDVECKFFIFYFLFFSPKKP